MAMLITLCWPSALKHHHFALNDNFYTTGPQKCRHLFSLETQSSPKRKIMCIGTHVFSLGHMILARREFHVCMFF